MTSWFENDLKVEELENKMKALTEEFNKRHNPEDQDYYPKLERFLNKKLRAEVYSIMREQLSMISNSILQHRKV